MVLREKKTYGYRERDEAKRQAFLRQIADYKPAQLVFVDEAGVDDTHDYPYGYCHRSERFYDLKLGHRTERISMVSGWSGRQIVAPMTLKGYCNTLLIEAWVEQILVPALKPNQVVVMDNAAIPNSNLQTCILPERATSLLGLSRLVPFIDFDDELSRTRNQGF